MLSCREVTRLVSDSHERRLGLQERMSLRMHLAMCSACSKFEQQMATVREALHRFAESETPGEGADGPQERG